MWIAEKYIKDSFEEFRKKKEKGVIRAKKIKEVDVLNNSKTYNM